MPKRGRDPVEQPTSYAVSGLSSQNHRKRKRNRTGPDSGAPLTTEIPVKMLANLPAKPVVEAVVAPTEDKTSKKKTGKVPRKSPLAIPTKRSLIPGRLKRLAVPKPVSLAARKSDCGTTRIDVNRRGNKVNKGWGTGGFGSSVEASESEDAEEPVKLEGVASVKGKQKAEKIKPDGPELWITRKTSYPAYLRSGVAAFIEKGCVRLNLLFTLA